MSKKPMTELDKKLQEIAVLNWHQFAALFGEACITSAKICLMRQAGASYGQIQNKLSLKKHIVEYSCGKCESAGKD